VHGYDVRRELLSGSADKWANVQPGSTYTGRELRRGAGGESEDALTPLMNTVAQPVLLGAPAVWHGLLIMALLAVLAVD